MAFSPVTAPKKVYVINLNDRDKDHITQVMQPYRQTPWLRINTRAVESGLATVPWVASAQARFNAFGRGTVALVERVPVAMLRDKPGWLIDDEGTLYQGEVEDGLVPVTVSSLDLDLSLASGFPGKDIATVVQETAKRLPQMDYSIEVIGQSVISLGVKDGPLVELGRLDDVPTKIEALATLVADDPERFSTARTVNLSAPDMPTVVPGR